MGSDKDALKAIAAILEAVLAMPGAVITKSARVQLESALKVARGMK